MNLRLSIVLLALLACISTTDHVLAQSADEFRSCITRFSIHLGKPSGFSGNGTAGGASFPWKTDKHEIVGGSYELRGVPLAREKDGSFSYGLAVEKYFNKFSVNSTILQDGEEIEHLGKDGKQFLFAKNGKWHYLQIFPDGEIIYFFSGSVSENDETSLKTVKDLFKTVDFLSESECDLEYETRIAKSSPKPFDPYKVFPKQSSDASDQNLVGTVKKVVTFVARYALNDSLRLPKITKIEEFDNNGNLLSLVEYDSSGQPYQITIYGVAENKRVLRSEQIEGDFDPPRFGVLPTESPATNTSKVPNYTKSISYKYLNGKLSSQITTHSSLGIASNIEFVNKKNLRETIYRSGYEVNNTARAIATLNDLGHETEIRYREKGRPEIKNTFNYTSCDKNKNWLEREVLETTDLGFGVVTYKERVESRKIFYFENE